MNILKTLINNYKFYGLYNYIKIIFYEIFYQIYFLRFSDFKTNRPLNIKIKSKRNSYNEKYLPTPYYFLEIINQQIFNKRKVLIDFGCGNGRVLNYFNNRFSNLIGFDLNLDFLNLKTSNKSIQINKFDLRKISLFKKRYSNLKKKNKVLFFYDPFEINLISKIINFICKKEDLIILIHAKKKYFKNFKVIFKKEFLDKNKNIIILKKN
jgi:SAM-dependent methyltransferase